VYTAFLFAQAKARDLWQSPLLPPHLLVQAVMAGAAAGVLLAAWLEPDLVAPLAWWLAGGSLVHLLMVAGELTLPHPTAHARTAAHELTSGRFATPFRVGIGLAVLALAAPLATAVAVPSAIVALAGLLAFEHAYVQAGQSVPLA
ncbi:MAG: NrfD/PsrC family molybdoenzyme membrane anchor subunit, partial [Actinomycetota bacterium]